MVHGAPASKGCFPAGRLHSPLLLGASAHSPPGLAHGLEAPLEVLVVVAVDDGVDAGVGERQPVGEGEDVAGQKVHLVSVQACVVRHHHEGPERQPGQHEQQRHQDEHLDHLDLLLIDLGLAAPSPTHLHHGVGQLPLSVCNDGGEQLDADAAVHQRDDGEGQQVDVHKQNRRVHLPHVRLGKVLVAGVQG